MENKTVLVTGGAGYIGSHMVRLLLEQGLTPVIFDNLSTGHREFVPKGVPLVKGDLRRLRDIEKAFQRYAIDAVIHFAAAIVVPESVTDPLKYYDNNVTGTVNLLTAMQKARVKPIVFSSSACVYGDPRRSPVTETEPLKVENPYGATKIMGEEIVKSCAEAGNVRYVIFRYFNVAGAHPSGEIGIKMDKPTHLIPNVMAVATGKKKGLQVFGSDYATPDGTCVRDYVHVLDLCDAHLLALQTLWSVKTFKGDIFNLGNGRGFTVLEVIREAEKVTGRKVPFQMAPRRPGDCQSVVASFSKARKTLGWKPQRKLKDILASAWAWEQKLLEERGIARGEGR